MAKKPYYKIALERAVGRPKVFETPEDLANAAEAYFKFTDATPWRKAEYKSITKSGQFAGSELKLTKTPMRVPYTLSGFLAFYGLSNSYLRTFKMDKEKCTPGFLTVINAIEEIVYKNQFEGAAAGFYNGNIISRALGLVDKSESTNTNLNSVPMTKKEIKDIAKELGDEY